MAHDDLASTVDAAWEDRANVGLATQGKVREAVEEAVNLLDSARPASRKRAAADGRCISG
jgi:2,3,4,5-tetrahydropyridine-2-carboxylate N-succinyltransferase